MTPRDFTLLILAWLGAVVIAFLVYEWRQDNDLGDLRDRVNELEGDLGIGDDGVAFEPSSATLGTIELTIVSSTSDDERIEGIIDGKGALALRATNNGPDRFVLSELNPTATAEDGAACQAFFDQRESVGFVDEGQSDEARIIWDCENLARVTIGGVDFAQTD